MKYLINNEEVHLEIFKRELKKAIKDNYDEEDFADWVNSKYLPGGVSISSGYYTAYTIISNGPDKSVYKDTLELWINTLITIYTSEMWIEGTVFKMGHTRFEIEE